MKTWKTITITALTTSTLIVAGVLTYNYLQPSQYQGETFNNDRTTTISNVSTDSSVYDSSTTTETYSSNTTTYTDGAEYYSTEQITEEYNTLWVYASAQKGYCDRDGNKVNRSGFYVLSPVQNHTNYVEVIEIDMRTNDEYHVKVYGGTDEISDINYQSACSNAEAFCNWLREQAPDGHTTHGLQSNYDYWVENCKNKYN